MHARWMLGMLGLFFIVQSCKKPQYGCTDPDSANYCADCDEDDGTCTYKGKVDFWFNQATMDSINKHMEPMDLLSFYVNKKIVTQNIDLEMPISTMEQAPDCKGDGIVSITIDLGTTKSKMVTFSIRQFIGQLVWEYPIEVKANACIQQQLVWRGEGFKFKAFK